MEKKNLLVEESPWAFNFEKHCDLKESLEIKENGDTIILKGVPCTILDKKNQNGRVYPSAMMQKSLDQAKQFIDSRSAICQAHDHPEGTFVKPIDASHLVIKAYVEDVPNVGKVLFNDWEILPTANGKDLAALINANVSMGTSIRGLGNMNGNVVGDYEFLGTDVVGNPSSGTFTRMFEKPVFVESVTKVVKEDTEIELKDGDSIEVELAKDEPKEVPSINKDDEKVNNETKPEDTETTVEEPKEETSVTTEEEKETVAEDERKPIACNSDGVCIYDIIYDTDDSVVTSLTDEPLQIMYTDEEESRPYFVFNDITYFMDEFMRVDSNEENTEEDSDVMMESLFFIDKQTNSEHVISSMDFLDNKYEYGYITVDNLPERYELVPTADEQNLSFKFNGNEYIFNLTDLYTQPKFLPQDFIDNNFLVAEENNLIENNVLNLGENKMVKVDLSDLPELKSLQKGDAETAVHQNPAPIDREIGKVTDEKDHNEGALKAGPNKTVGYFPSPADIKKIKMQSYDTNNVLAREKVRVEERCQELAQMLAESRQNLADYAEKYAESQKIVQNLVGQMAAYTEALDNKDPATFKADAEKRYNDLKESSEREYNTRKEQAVTYVSKLMKEAQEKHKELAESYEVKLTAKNEEISNLNNALTEAKKAKEEDDKKAKEEKENLKKAGKKLAKESVDKIAERAADLNEKLVKESVALINKALEESSKVHEKLNAEINMQKELLEQVDKYFEIACVINDSLSEALTNECAGKCCKRRKETPMRRARQHR